MSNAINLGADDGFVPVTIGATTQNVDLYLVWLDVCEAVGLPTRREFTEAVQKILAGLGFPDASGWAAERFAEQIVEWHKAVKKNAGGPGASQDSAGGTAATPAA